MTRAVTAAGLLALWLLDGPFTPEDLPAVGTLRADQAGRLSAAERGHLIDLLTAPPPKAGQPRQEGTSPRWQH